MDRAKHDATIATLREQGYEISDTTMHPDGRFRIGIRSHDAKRGWRSAKSCVILQPAG